MWAAINPELLYETVRIRYKYRETEKIYIIDFEDPVNKVLYEVKPQEHTTSSNFKAKKKAALEWCDRHDYTYVIITQHELKQYHDEILNSSLNENIKQRFKKL